MPSAAYNAELADAGRVPFWLVELAMPRCGLTRGTSPCQAAVGADNTHCSQSYATCDDRDNFDSDGAGGTLETTITWRFTSHDVTIPPTFFRTWPQVWPLVKHVGQVGQELRIEDGLSLPDKLAVTLFPIRGMGAHSCPYFDIDKSVRNTGDPTGDFWRRFLRIWPNYHLGTLKLWRGFYTPTFATTDLEERWKGDIEDMQIQKDGGIAIEAHDVFVSRLLQVPPQISSWNVVEQNRDRDDTTFLVTDGTEFTDPADITGKVHAEVDTFDGGTEFVEITSISSNTLTVTRGALNTIPTPIRNRAGIREIINIGTDLDDNGVHPFDAAVDILNRAGIPSADINQTQIDLQKTWLGPAVAKRRIREPMDARELVMSLLKLWGAVAYVDDTTRQVKIFMFRPPDNSESVTFLYDEDNVLVHSASTKTGERLRLTHARIKYADADEGDARTKHAVGVNNTTFSPHYYGDTAKDKREKVIETEWIQPWDELGAGDIVVRAAILAQYPRAIFTFEAELRDDETITMGEIVNVTTRDVQDATGAKLVFRGAVIGKKITDHGRFEVTIQETGLGNAPHGGQAGATGEFDLRWARIGAKEPGGSPDYDAETAEEQALQSWIGDASNNVGAADDDGYYLF